MAQTKEQNSTEMSFGDHLEELRIRVILSLLGIGAGLILCLFFSRFFLSLLAKPYYHAIQQSDIDAGLLAITLPEKFLVYLKTALFFGLIFSSPWVFYQLWKFISAGLYASEKKIVYIITPLCTTLFIAGAAFYLFVIAPIVISFFVNFDTGIDFLKTQVTLQSYINFMFSMTLVFALSFQMPLAIVAANRIGILPLESLKNGRKFVVLGILIAAAFATPPDVISQIALAVPIYVLYELAVIFCVSKTKNHRNA
ncbi:MAG: twin-arginine translocase subunit TatC [Sedimentisphaerales bacterium]|nr:twin-arginine translocase subunit TatC [Sedimentisphaerales bacterium]